MASSLNLLVLRLAQFHSENSLGGIAAFLGRNEEDLIAAAIAEQRASLSVHQHARICSNSNSLVQQKKSLSPLVSTKTLSWWSLPSHSSSSSSIDSKLDSTSQRTPCSNWNFLTCQKRKRRHWHLRRSPQNIKHLLYFNRLLDNHKVTFVRRSVLPNQHHQPMNNHVAENTISQQHRISI